MLNPNLLSEAWRMFKRSRSVKKSGIKKYKGNAKKICKQIIDDCWNGKYFQVSNGHFCEFYIRDFGWCIDSLIKLGHRDKVLKSLDYALNIYSKKGLTTTITPKGKCINVFNYAPDSLAYLIRSLRVAKATKLIKKYKPFLIKEINKFEKKVIDKKTGLVKKRNFSSMKDHSKRKSSTYDNIMAAMLNNELNLLNLKNPLKKYNIKNNIKNKLWKKTYFLDDITNKTITGDSNIFPFWTGVFKNKNMLKKSLNSIQKANLDKPFPLKYSTKTNHKMIFADFFAKDYEKDSIWMHMGPLYIQLLKKINKKQADGYINKYTKLIEKHKNFLEVFKSNGKPFKSQFYYSDESMLWAANYLTLK